MGPRKSDHGGEVTASSVGANVRVLWREEELERIHFASIQVPWSYVGKLRDEAEKNVNSSGIMTVDLATLKSDGVAVFSDEFAALFREIFVRRFIPCLHEKFNQRDPTKPLSKLPDDVADALKLLVLCERLKAAMKQDVKDHIDRLLAKTNANLRPNEGAPYKVVQASLELDTPTPPRGTLQERVVHRATEMLASMLPDSLDALQELVQLACEMGRHEMASRLFRATAEKALSLSGVRVPLKGMPPGHQSAQAAQGEPDSLLDAVDPALLGSTNNNNSNDKQRVVELTEQNERLRRELQQERAKVEQMQGGRNSNNNSFESADNNNNAEGGSFRRGSGDDARQFMVAHGSQALFQGIVLEKVGKSAGERIVRLAGDALEWRKGNGRFTKEHTILRHDVVSVKVVDPQGKTFLLSTRTGLLTLRALTEPACNLLVTALESWVKGAPPRSALKRAPAPPALAAQQHKEQPNPNSLASRFQRMSFSFKRSSFRGGAQEQALATNPVPAGGKGHVDYSFASNNGGESYLNDLEN